MGTPENLPRLEYIYVHNNQIQGEIPDLSGVPRLYYLIMYNNQLTGYKNGSFASLTRIRYIDLSTNSITQLSLNKYLMTYILIGSHQIVEVSRSMFVVMEH